MYHETLTQLTEDELTKHYSQLLERESAVINEQNRRRALPFIWQNETQIIQGLRATGVSATPEAGEPYEKPINILDAYIAGDEVTVEGVGFRAFGEGAIMHEPGTSDPVMGDRWELI